MVRAAGTARGQGQDAVRKLILLVTVLGCAQLGSPPGGPEDHAAPHLAGGYFQAMYDDFTLTPR